MSTLQINKEQERKLIREPKQEETLNMVRTRRLENLYQMEMEENDALYPTEEFNFAY